MHPVTREELVRLTRRDDGKALRHWLLRLGFHVGSLALAAGLFAHGHRLLGLLALLPHFAAFSFLGWAGIGHELFHNSVFSSRRLNRALFRLCSMLTWSNYGYFEASHIYHHRHTLAPEDAEGLPHPAILRHDLFWLFSLDLPSLVRRVRILALNAYDVVPSGGAAGSLFMPGSGARRALVRAARTTLGVQFGLMTTFALMQASWLILAINLAPFCLTFFNRTLAICQHYGLSSKARGDYLDSCRTVVLHPVMAFFYAHMNYHVEHHMYPSVPFYNLPELSALLRQRIFLPHVEHGYLAALRTLGHAGLFRA